MDFVQKIDLGTALLGAGIAVIVYAIAKAMSSSSSSKPARKPVLVPDQYVKVPLIAKIPVTTGVACPVTLYRFGLPQPDVSLDLPIGQHIYLRANIDGEEISRPYTPTTTNDDLGHFDLVIKVYPTGKMSRHVDSLKIGDSIEITGPKGRFRYTRNMNKHISMICGGTGITPMLQVLAEVFKDTADATRFTLIFGNVTFEDIILKDKLDALATRFPIRFVVHYILDKPPAGWTGLGGYVTKDVLSKHLPAAQADDGNNRVLMCGPPPMLKALTANLQDLGFQKDQLFFF